MQRQFRRVFTSLKEQSCVSYAKIATIGGFCDLDLVVVKATSPDDLPVPDRYVHELLKNFSISPTSFRAFSLSFTRRFSKTQCWRVALKCLILLHRLLRSLPNKSPFRTELLWARSNRLISLYPCHFRDSSSSDPEHYSIFIKSYAQLLNEALDSFSIDNSDMELDDNSLRNEMKEMDQMLELLPQLQSLIDRVMDCRPSGQASRSFIVQSAMKFIIRDSFICYKTFRNEIVGVLDYLFQMPYQNCVEALGIYKKAATQATQLFEFYEWCKSMGLCGLYEYPFVDKIPQIQIRALESFLNGMWQITTAASSSTESPLTSTFGSPLSFTEEESGQQVMRKVVEKEEEEPLIQYEVDDNVSWEELLEASISSRLEDSRNNLFLQSNGYGYGNNAGDGSREEGNQLQMQIYKPTCALNPFNQPYNIPFNNGSWERNSFPWGL